MYADTDVYADRLHYSYSGRDIHGYPDPNADLHGDGDRSVRDGYPDRDADGYTDRYQHSGRDLYGYSDPNADGYTDRRQHRGPDLYGYSDPNADPDTDDHRMCRATRRPRCGFRTFL